MFKTKRKLKTTTGNGTDYYIEVGVRDDEFEVKIQWFQKATNANNTEPKTRPFNLLENKFFGGEGEEEALQKAREWIAENDQDGR